MLLIPFYFFVVWDNWKPLLLKKNFAGIYLAQKMSPEKRDELVEAIQKIGDREEKSTSPSPTVSEGEVSP